MLKEIFTLIQLSTLLVQPYHSSQRYRQALEHLKSGEAAHQTSADFWTLVGLAHYRVGDSKSSLAALDRASALTEPNSLLLAVRAVALAHEGRTREATSMLNAAKDLMKMPDVQDSGAVEQLLGETRELLKAK